MLLSSLGFGMAFLIKTFQWILDETLDHLVSIASQYQDKQKKLGWCNVSLRNDRDSMGVTMIE